MPYTRTSLTYQSQDLPTSSGRQLQLLESEATPFCVRAIFSQEQSFPAIFTPICWCCVKNLSKHRGFVGPFVVGQRWSPSFPDEVLIRTRCGAPRSCSRPRPQFSSIYRAEAREVFRSLRLRLQTPRSFRPSRFLKGAWGLVRTAVNQRTFSPTG